MEPRLGVISPEGKFHTCGYACHESLCKQICEELGYYTRWDERFTGDEVEKILNTYTDTLYYKNWAIITFQYDGTPLFMIEDKYTSKQWEIVEKLIDEFSCLTSGQLCDVILDNREKFNNYWSCGFTYRNDLDMENIRKKLNQERRDFQINPQEYVLNVPN